MWLFPLGHFPVSQCRATEAKSKVLTLLVQNNQTNWSSKGKISDMKKSQRSESKNLCTNSPAVIGCLLSYTCTGERASPHQKKKNLQKIVAKMLNN